MQDTFYINNQVLLRTHTSGSQVHFMKNNEPPVRILSPGRVYRNEDISVRSYCLFHQIEGLYVDKNVTFSELKGTLEYFAKEFFGSNVKTRFRPSYFPFTEPSAEMDVYWGLNSESDYRITKGTGWLEILGCGMVDPEVFKSVEYDSDKYSGFAFGLGIERIAMLKYGIDDIRLLYEGDCKFLEQFKNENIKKLAKHYIESDRTNSELVDYFTQLGLECNYHLINSLDSNIVVGKVVECIKHPDADRLKVCQVDIASESNLTIICGAPNVKENILVPIAKIGSHISDFEIKKTKIRGIYSYGMICSEKELGLGENHDGIMILDNNLKVDKIS